MLSVRDRIRISFGPSLFLGITLQDWKSLFQDNKNYIDPAYRLRAMSIFLNSCANSAFRQWEESVYGPKVRQVKIPPPLFVLGHRRSGTTLLYNLLAMDRRFAYSNVYQIYFPHTFLSTEALFADLLGAFMPKKRPSDNMAIGISMPAEDEFAMLVATLCSPYLRYVFPKRAAYFQRYLTLRNVKPEKVEMWKGAFLYFLQKLTWKYRRPLVLKSPPHTARIRLLLEMFPDARFVHIRRNPYHVFRSSQHVDALAFRSFALQPAPRDWEQQILTDYQETYDAFFEERDMIPAGHLHEICFEDLEKDPLGETQKVYETLGLPHFEEARPTLQGYANSLLGYRKNDFAPIPQNQRYEIGRAWRRSFETWGYPL